METNVANLFYNGSTVPNHNVNPSVQGVLWENKKSNSQPYVNLDNTLNKNVWQPINNPRLSALERYTSNPTPPTPPLGEYMTLKQLSMSLWADHDEGFYYNINTGQAFVSPTRSGYDHTCKHQSCIYNVTKIMRNNTKYVMNINLYACRMLNRISYYMVEDDLGWPCLASKDFFPVKVNPGYGNTNLGNPLWNDSKWSFKAYGRGQMEYGFGTNMVKGHPGRYIYLRVYDYQKHSAGYTLTMNFRGI